MKFRKKPVIIEAKQYLNYTTSRIELAEFVGKAITFFDDHATIATLEGTMRANINDWIIKGVKGEFYPCKPEIFNATYEKAEE